MRLTTASIALAVTVITSACYTPKRAVPARPPAADRYERAASQDPVVRAGAIDELVFDPAPTAVQYLQIMLERDVDPMVRTRAANAIAERRDPSIDWMLERAATYESDPEVRRAAKRAYERLWPWRKSPGTAAALSLLCAGCGQMYNRDIGEGFAQMAATYALLFGGLGLIASADEQPALDEAASSAKVPIGLALATAGQNMAFYSIFDAYRDARIARGEEGYSHAITRESLGELAFAPFNPSVLKSPWVWGGVPIALAAGLGFSYLLDKDAIDEADSIFEVDKVNVLGRDFRNRGAGFAAGSAYYIGLFAPVGVGEEALFRGLIQTEMEERFGCVGGLVVSSAIFGGVHVFNFLADDPKDALVAVPFIAVLGSSLGLAYQHTGYKLSTSVAMHFWYDTLLSMAAFALDPEHQPFVVNYTMLP